MRIRGGSSVLAVAIALVATPVAAGGRPFQAAAVAPAGATALAPAPVSETGTPPAGASERARHHRTKGDPLEGFNRVMFSINQVFDRILFRPVAMAYKTVVPKVARKGIRHFFSNIGEPLVFANDVLQLKPRRAVQTLGRFVVNTTVGVGGLLDVAKTQDFRLPHRDNSFGDTLGHYGIGPGPYVFLPFFGPTDFRDLGAGIAESQTLPFTIGTPFDRAEYRVSEAVLTGLDLRVEADGELKALLAGAVDPYATLRSSYLQDRAGRVAATHGKGGTGAGALSDPLADPLADPASGASSSAPATGAATTDPLADPLADPTAGAANPAPAPSQTVDPLADPLQDPAASAAPATPPR
ncbi:MlaA family lipoprotein [Sphingomonas sp. PAMC 26621]|uniref:MlaA family lipoprotein n=1 Tax=Sphingomonas sp. PAMC 26621 TaxID=1112213 RepID=UPI0002880452|nr:VacJ family lipoprotein [Sphingomonas sp. PAMC 26621]